MQNKSVCEPTLPSRVLRVPGMRNEFKLGLAESRYHAPEEVRIISAVALAAVTYSNKIGDNQDDTVPMNATFGNVVMGELIELNRTERRITCTGTLANADMDESLEKMIKELHQH